MVEQFHIVRHGAVRLGPKPVLILYFLFTGIEVQVPIADTSCSATSAYHLLVFRDAVYFTADLHNGADVELGVYSNVFLWQQQQNPLVEWFNDVQLGAVKNVPLLFNYTCSKLLLLFDSQEANNRLCVVANLNILEDSSYYVRSFFQFNKLDMDRLLLRGELHFTLKFYYL